jgi:hypothetical protein
MTHTGGSGWASLIDVRSVHPGFRCTPLLWLAEGNTLPHTPVCICKAQVVLWSGLRTLT